MKLEKNLAPNPTTPAAEWIELRPAVLAFARLMEEKLRENDHKGGWGTMSAASLFVRLVEETGELASLVDRMRGLPEIAWRAKIAREAADVANFAMMIADNFGSAPREV